MSDNISNENLFPWAGNNYRHLASEVSESEEYAERCMEIRVCPPRTSATAHGHEQNMAKFELQLMDARHFLLVEMMAEEAERDGVPIPEGEFMRMRLRLPSE